MHGRFSFGQCNFVAPVPLVGIRGRTILDVVNSTPPVGNPLSSGYPLAGVPDQIKIGTDQSKIF